MRILTFDIGGTFIKFGFFNGSTLCSADRISTEAGDGAEHIIDILARKTWEAMSEGPLDGIGISTRGQVDFSHGVIIFDPPDIIPGYSGLPLREALRARLLDLNGADTYDISRLPIVIENDGNCAAIAENTFGAAREFDDCLCVVFGTAIGGAIIHNRHLYRGSRDSAGEFGMMYFPEKDGAVQSYERYASVTSLVEMATALDPALSDGKKITAALAGGDPQVTSICDAWCKRAAVGLSSLIHIFNPPCVVLGGGIMENQEIVSRISAHCLSLLAPGFEHVKLRAAALGNQAGMLGAAHLTVQALNQNP